MRDLHASKAESLDIAVVGGGIAGLSAVWHLSRRHRVTLYERWSRPGMDAHTVHVDCGDDRIAVNAPMRVFFPAYYPTLTALYRELGVACEPIRYSGSIGQLGGPTLFRYRNHWLGARSVPLLAGRSALAPSAWRIGYELLRLTRQRPRATSRDVLESMSIAEFLELHGYPELFREKFLYPVFAGICTCSYDAVRAMPAAVILDYLQSGLVGSKMQRLAHGTEDVTERMAAAAARTHFDMDLQAVTPGQQHVTVTDGQGFSARHDHVVIATQANQALRLLPESMAAERKVLRKFGYEASRILVHRDARLAPANRSEWAPVNFLLSESQDKPMASIVLNRIHPQLQDHPPLFETWNPFLEPDPADTLIDATVERPVVTRESLLAVHQLKDLHRDGARRVWFCGSYAGTGIPLLESATASARAVADRLNARVTGCPGNAPATGSSDRSAALSAAAG